MHFWTDGRAARGRLLCVAADASRDAMNTNRLQWTNVPRLECVLSSLAAWLEAMLAAELDSAMRVLASPDQKLFGLNLFRGGSCVWGGLIHFWSYWSCTVGCTFVWRYIALCWSGRVSWPNFISHSDDNLTWNEEYVNVLHNPIFLKPG